MINPIFRSHSILWEYQNYSILQEHQSPIQPTNRQKHPASIGISSTRIAHNLAKILFKGRYHLTILVWHGWLYFWWVIRDIILLRSIQKGLFFNVWGIHYDLDFIPFLTSLSLSTDFLMRAYTYRRINLSKTSSYSLRAPWTTPFCFFDFQHS